MKLRRTSLYLIIHTFPLLGEGVLCFSPTRLLSETFPAGGIYLSFLTGDYNPFQPPSGFSLSPVTV